MATLRWKPLPPWAKDVPALMVAPEFRAASYTLRVTDLANVWVEELDRKGILRRSLNEDTSIDPSEGPDQMLMLLTKIEAALDLSAPDHDQTSLTLRVSDDKHNKDNLILNITCILPGDLKPLTWPVHLTKCPPVSVATELVLPLVQAQHARRLEIEALITSLKEKDAVITKLVDKLEATGTGLENVFNSLSAKKKTTRAVAEEKVKGLAPFNESDWRSRAPTDQAAPADVTALIHEVFRTSRPVYRTDMGISASDDLNDWWTKLSGTVAAVKPRQDSEATDRSQVSQPRESRLAAKEDNDDDDFQVQSTPEGKRGGTAGADDATTDDEETSVIPDSLSAQPEPAKQSRLGAIGGSKRAPLPVRSSQGNVAKDDETASDSDDQPVKAQPRKRLGAIGGKKSKSTTPNTDVSSAASLRFHDDDGTASESDGEIPKPKSPPATTQPKKRGLGRIGGKANPKASSPQSLETSTPEPGVKAEVTPTRSATKKLGTIGHRKRDETKAEKETRAEPEQVETEEQRMERKRHELAAELERKPAGPAKKKRRF